MEYLLIEKIDSIGVITINRPDALNAMNAGVVTELSTAVSDMIADNNIGLVLIDNRVLFKNQFKTQP